MAGFTALYDACVLYPASLRDLLLSIARTNLFRARWTNQIHEEWIAALLIQRPELKDRLVRTRALMNEAVPDCLIEGYEPLIAGLTLPDPDDRHVLAAAIAGQASVIVTYNLADFPAELLRPWDIEAMHPDEFVMCQFDLDAPAVCGEIKKLRARLKNPPVSVEQYLQTLAQLRLPRVVEKLTEMKELI